jgi:hypothetical protein
LEEFPIFDESPSEEFEDIFGNDCAFEIKDEFEDLPIFEESPNEDFGGDFERVSIFDEFPNGDIDVGDCDVPIFDEYPNEEFDIHSKKGRLVDIESEEMKEANRVDLPLDVLPKPEEVVFDFPVPGDFIELKLHDSFHEMPLRCSLEQHICIVPVPEQVLELPKEDKYFLGRLEDPLGMVFTQANLGYEVKLDFCTTCC